ncbi:antibiotic biosynthesis monooxygenase [Ramlibacter tataouinensis]|uniref:antibiotic biosynthesis monooxygenase family protein n=1 Tax=Ramlibacter tataouinensis TaxID=94132 RepID=UPI0022F3B356|nr:antibiotic biosynthesis monooxygenase family protein [Ramlibacter tataouinensis]WBY03273.1 antibiotic biosynthesis monooxygenase [Ramlibacter tataouinensis]
MVHEIAVIEVTPGQEAGFEAAVRQAAGLFQSAKGCKGMALQREVERPNVYRLYVAWETLEDHTVAFRGSDAFTRWRALAGPFFASPPQVSHVETVLQPF